LPDFVDLGATWSVSLYGGALVLSINARAIGEVTEMFPFFTSAS